MNPDVEAINEREFEGFGPLTKSEYVRWFSILSTQSNPSFDAFSESRAEWEFDFISQSEYLVENFFALNRTLQRAIHLFADPKNNIDEICGFVILALHVADRNPSIDLGNTPVYEMDRFLALNIEVEAFSDLLGRYWGLYPETNRYLILGIPIMLAILVGEDVVLEALERWTSGGHPGSPIDFANVVLNWGELEEYSIDWAVGISRLE